MVISLDSSMESVAKGSYEELLIADGFYMLKIQNPTETSSVFKRKIDRSFLQFHFCLKGRIQFHYNAGNYPLAVAEENALLLYNPQKDLPLHATVWPNTGVVTILITLRKFHALFSNEAAYIPFLSEANQEKKYYAQEKISPAIAVVLSQLMNDWLHPSVQRLYVRGKVYELLALYFNRIGNADVEQCPFLADEDKVKRIKKAKEIMIARMAEPPTLPELAQEIGLSLKKLKEGFKQIYGDSVYSFLFEYKMDFARKMLETGRYNVNEVGLKIGYSTASHFIASFKKKYGTTPKKYLTSHG